MKILLLAFVVLGQIVGCVAHHPGPELLDNGVRFTLSAPLAKSVAIAGSFNQWNPHQDMLSDPPGRHEYLFVVNDEMWLPDPFAPSISDGMGGENSLLIMEESAR